MESSKLIKVLKTLSKREIKKFSEFLYSPYFNKNKDVVTLYEDLRGYYPKFNSEELKIENVFTRVFPGIGYDYHKISNLNSDLYQLVKHFLRLLAFEKKKLEADISLLAELHERKLDIPYSQIEKQVREKLESSNIKDEHYYYLQHGLDIINTSHFKFDKSKYRFNTIQAEFDSFLQYSLVGLLKHYSKMLHNRNHGNITFNMEMFENVLEYIKERDFNESPSCKIYKQIILVELYRNEKDYKNLLILKKELEDSISLEDKYYILLVINSFAVEQLRRGNESYHKDRYLAFRETIERNFFNNDVLFQNFISTFTSACMAGELKWAKDFKELYKEGIVPVSEKTNTVNYCDAFLAYIEKDYSKALELFAKTNFKLFLTKVMVKSYTTRIYYEMGLCEQALSSIDAFRHYLKSEKLISEKQKEAHYQFLNYITSLIKIRLENSDKYDNAEIVMLRNEINKMNQNPMGVKNWLINKVQEI